MGYSLCSTVWWHCVYGLEYDGGVDDVSSERHLPVQYDSVSLVLRCKQVFYRWTGHLRSDQGWLMLPRQRLWLCRWQYSGWQISRLRLPTRGPPMAVYTPDPSRHASSQQSHSTLISSGESATWERICVHNGDDMVFATLRLVADGSWSN